MIRKKAKLITREKPDFRDWFKKDLTAKGFACESIETPFKKGFPDLIAIRRYTWFLELKWLRNVKSEQDPLLLKKLVDETSTLQEKWLAKHAGHSWISNGQQVYGIVGGYYDGPEVKTCFFLQTNHDEGTFMTNFKDWDIMDSASMT